MDASNWINLSILVVAAIAALVAIFQVVEARRARDEARVARDDAAKHEQEALDAAKRSADSAVDSAAAQRRLATAAEEQLDMIRRSAAPPWRIERVDDTRWKITNATGENVDFFTLNAKPDAIERVGFNTIARDVAKNESLFFNFGGFLNSPPSVNLVVAWRDASRNGQEYVETIP
ncbi:hypothetical protein [Leifsonia naganoensis]|uniref:Uncharacterized protein n=1 Tax=Leifsonia naganoensis TaxID=150025 RepID=A0A853DHK5_9MICO|nr:hypothetical protein [Leifsonia naganoensis]NYK08576.1 hypothetical protein [Leifsonia naganoensis]